MEGLNNRSLISAPVSAIIITLMICFTALFVTGYFDEPAENYATVHFDGGFKKIGVIGQQSYFSEVKIEKDNEVLASGSIEDVVETLSYGLDSADDPQNSTLVAGVTISGSAGISWVGSESSFKLNVEEIDMKSTSESEILVRQAIEELNAINDRIKAEHQDISDRALTFSENPGVSFTLSKIISALRDF